MDWLEAKFKALEIEAELQNLKKNLHQRSHTGKHQTASSHTGNHQTKSENHEQKSKSSPQKNHHYYSVFGLQPGASPKEIKQAYRDLVLVWHPDRFPNNHRLQKIAEEKIKEINTAYDKLGSGRE